MKMTSLFCLHKVVTRIDETPTLADFMKPAVASNILYLKQILNIGRISSCSAFARMRWELFPTFFCKVRTLFNEGTVVTRQQRYVLCLVVFPVQQDALGCISCSEYHVKQCPRRFCKYSLTVIQCLSLFFRGCLLIIFYNA